MSKKTKNKTQQPAPDTVPNTPDEEAVVLTGAVATVDSEAPAQKSVAESFADPDTPAKPQEKEQGSHDAPKTEHIGKMVSGKTALGQAFIIALTLKLAFAAASIVFGSPWVLGFGLPLAVMGLYMIYGWMSVRNDNAERKISFGDSCYYLGFLFTIASIILALCDLGEKFEIQDIAIRFGAAMLTTLLGMAVRVYYVTFAREQAARLKERFDHLVKDAQPSDDMSVIIQANCHNLALLNKTLMVSLHEFEQLRANINALNGRVTHDLETNVENVRQTSETIMANTQQTLDTMMQNATQTLADMSSSLEKSAQDMLAQNAQTNEALNKESAKKIESLTQISAERIENAGAHFAEKVKHEGDLVHTAVQTLGERLDRVFAKSENRWEPELDKATDSLMQAVEKFNRDVEALKLPSTYLDASAQSMTDHVNDNCQNIKQATDRLTEQTESFNAAMQSLATTIKSQPLVQSFKPSLWGRLTGGIFKR